MIIWSSAIKGFISKKKPENFSVFLNDADMVSKTEKLFTKINTLVSCGIYAYEVEKVECKLHIQHKIYQILVAFDDTGMMRL